MGKSTSCFDIFPPSVENELLLVHEVRSEFIVPVLLIDTVSGGGLGVLGIVQ